MGREGQKGSFCASQWEKKVVGGKEGENKRERREEREEIGEKRERRGESFLMRQTGKVSFFDEKPSKNCGMILFQILGLSTQCS